jgi:hypothetical protein
MHKIFSKISFFCTALMLPFGMFSQINSPDITNAVQDMLYVSSEYVSSAASASVYQSSSSWYSSAESVGKFKLDVSLHFNVLPIPNKQKTFNISNSELLTMEIRGAQSAEIPTALGGHTDTFFDFTIDDEAYEWQAFEGIKQDVVAHPYIQATVGLWKETDVTLRYSPKVTINTSSYDIFGAAIKHNITQYFRKEMEDSNPIELAVLASYSIFNLNLYFDEVAIEPIDPKPGSEPLTSIDSIIIDANSWLFQLIASKRVNNFEFTGSLGYTANDFNYKLGGQDGLFLDLFNELLSLLDESKSEFKGDIGVNYYFNKFYISSMVTVGKFPNVNMALHYKFL